MAASTEADNFAAAQVAFKGTIHTFARNCVVQLPGFAIEDVEQELLFVLWQCVRNYNPDKGASFNTLFQGSARNKVISLVRSAQTQKRKAIWVDLDDDAVRFQVESLLRQGSAEDSVMALLEIERRLAG